MPPVVRPSSGARFLARVRALTGEWPEPYPGGRVMCEAMERHLGQHDFQPFTRGGDLDWVRIGPGIGFHAGDRVVVQVRGEVEQV